MIILAIAAAVTVHLKDYTRDPIGLYDQGGQLIRKAPKKELAKPPFDVEAEGGFVSFKTKDGGVVYLRNSDVLVEGGRPTCAQPMLVAQSASSHTAAGDIGVRSGMGTADLPCIPPSH